MPRLIGTRLRQQLPVPANHCRGGDSGWPRWTGGKYSTSRWGGHSPSVGAQSHGTVELDASGRMAVPERRCSVWFGGLARLAGLRLGTTGGSAASALLATELLVQIRSSSVHVAADLRRDSHRHGRGGAVSLESGLVAAPAPRGVNGMMRDPHGRYTVENTLDIAAPPRSYLTSSSTYGMSHGGTPKCCRCRC